MDNPSALSLNTRFNHLDPKIKAIIASVETGDITYSICEKYGVERRTFSYSNLIGMVLLGDLNPNLLVKNIVEKEGIDVEKAKAIALDLSAAIFQPIKQELMAMYGIVPKQAPPPTASPPQSAREIPNSQPSPSPPPTPQPSPSSRPAGDSLQGIPNAAPPPAPNSSSANTSQPPAANNEPKIGMPAPLSTPLGRTFYSPTPSGPQKSSVIDLSKEPPKPVAKPGEPPLEGNIVNLKNVGNI